MWENCNVRNQQENHRVLQFSHVIRNAHQNLEKLYLEKFLHDSSNIEV